MSREQQEKIWLAGYAQAMQHYAIWRDGAQFIGVMQHPLKPAIEGLSSDDYVTADMRASLQDLACPPKGQ